MRDTCQECGEPIILIGTALGGQWVHVDERETLARQFLTHWVSCRGPVATPPPVEVPPTLATAGANCSFCGGTGQVLWRDFTDRSMEVLLRCVRCEGLGVDAHPPARKLGQKEGTP
jgi:hypothetical protein